MKHLGKTGNRKRILECAQRLFYAKGYDAVGVQEIVDLAGTTKPTMYYYFKSKQGLLECLLDENAKGIGQRLKATAAKGKDTYSVLENVMREYLNIVSEKKEMYMLMLTFFFSAKENETHKAVKPYMVDQYCAMREIFTMLDKGTGELKGRGEQMAISFTGMINYYILVRMQNGDHGINLFDDGEIHAFINQFLYGICYEKK